MMKANLTFNLPNDLFKLFQLYAESPTFRDLLGFDGIRTQQVKDFITWIVENKYEYDLLSWIRNVLDKKDERFSNETNLQRLFLNLGNNIADVTKSVKEYFETLDYPSEILENPIFFIEKLNKESNYDWDVLTVDRANRRALVLCREAISMDYNLIKKTKDYKWSENEINKYLNTEFIKLLHEENIASVRRETNGEMTNEKIFLLSKDEVNRYLPYVPGRIPYSTRIAKMWNYENCEFVPVNWSLRDLNPAKSNEYNGSSVYFVSTEGKMCDSYYGEYSLGLRPALWVKY
jgi:hypothetical protein